MQEIYNKLIKRIDKDRVYKNELMSKHTSFKVGGPADLFIRVNNLEELQFILKTSNENNIQITIIGNGTNVLVKDNGIRGIVLKIEFKEVKVENEIIIAEAGALLSKVAKIACENSLSGLECIAGIPGTIGGAVKMNAGAYGQEIKDLVYETIYLDEKLNIKMINNNEHKFSYRKSIFSNNKYFILSTKLKLRKEEKERIELLMKEIFAKRKEKQPLEYPNAGSIFKRGINFTTAELIDKCGLKGYNIGNAYISEKHAGFIINKGNATATDILQLIEKVKEEVYKKFNKTIELELEVLGE